MKQTLMFVLSSEVGIKSYDLIRIDRSKNGGGMVCLIKQTVVCGEKTNMLLDSESIFTDTYINMYIWYNIIYIYTYIYIYMSKSKPFIVENKPPNKIDFVSCMDHIFSKWKIFSTPKTQKFYLLGDISINLLSKGQINL